MISNDIRGLARNLAFHITQQTLTSQIVNKAIITLQNIAKDVAELENSTIPESLKDTPSNVVQLARVLNKKGVTVGNVNNGGDAA